MGAVGRGLASAAVVAGPQPGAAEAARPAGAAKGGEGTDGGSGSGSGSQVAWGWRKAGPLGLSEASARPTVGKFRT